MKITALDIARRFAGTKERAGELDHPDIQAWLYHAGLGPDAHDEVPWCGAFVGFPSYILGLSRPRIVARARAWLTVGRQVELSQAVPGFDVVILSRGRSPQPGPDVIEAPGHVGFFVEYHRDRVNVLSGNRADRVSLDWYDADRVLGVRRLYEEDHDG